MLTIVLCVFGYSLVGGCTIALTMYSCGQKEFMDDPGPLFSGLFWPITLPMIGAYVTCKKALKAKDQRDEARAKEEAELKARVQELEDELKKPRA
jgi:hypothetical protein